MLDTNHIKHVEQNRLLRPLTLTRLWPSVPVLPPLLLYPSSIWEPFLEDLGDLEDPELDASGKLRIVERMWRSWGTAGEGVVRPRNVMLSIRFRTL